MRANLLHVFACYANPLRWRARLENCRRFEHHILRAACRLPQSNAFTGDAIGICPIVRVSGECAFALEICYGKKRTCWA
jgi:hypothetical protein